MEGSDGGGGKESAKYFPICQSWTSTKNWNQLQHVFVTISHMFANAQIWCCWIWFYSCREKLAGSSVTAVLSLICTTSTIRKNLIAKFCIIDVDFPFWVQFCIIMQNWGNILKNFALLKLLKLKVGNLSNFLQYLAHLFHKLCLIYVIFFSLTINWHNSWGWDKSFHSITALCKQIVLIFGYITHYGNVHNKTGVE